MEHLEPSLSDTDAVLRCHAKRRLYRAFRQAGSRVISEWLFANPQQPFHMNVGLPPPSFRDVIAVRAVDVTSTADSTGVTEDNAFRNTTSSPQSQAEPQKHVIPGRDLLFVPVYMEGGRVLGYTFGAGVVNDDVAATAATTKATSKSHCPFDLRRAAFPPHAVGRFTFDAALHDLLMVAPDAPDCSMSIMHFRCGRDGERPVPNAGAESNVQNDQARERTWFIVPFANYGYRQLPGRVINMQYIPEHRMPSQPRYQFPSPPPNTPPASLRDAMAALERFVKGGFASENSTNDEMDRNTGQVLNRITFSTVYDFDVENAVAVNVFKDFAVRKYYSYMSSVSNQI